MLVAALKVCFPAMLSHRCFPSSIQFLPSAEVSDTWPILVCMLAQGLFGAKGSPWHRHGHLVEKHNSLPKGEQVTEVLWHVQLSSQ